MLVVDFVRADGGVTNRVEVGVRVIVTLPSGTGKVAVCVLVGSGVEVAVEVGVEVEVDVEVAEAVTVGVGFQKARGDDQRLTNPNPSTMTTRPNVRVITRALQETFRGWTARGLLGARKCSGRGTVC